MCVCPSVRNVTHERVDGCRPNLIGMGKLGDPLEAISAAVDAIPDVHGCRINFPLSLT